MSSHRRAPGIPDVPPFRGPGPLQARGVPNQTTTSILDRGYPASMKAAPAPPATAMAPPSSKTSSQRRPPTSTRDSSSSSSSKTSSSQGRSQRAEGSRDAEPKSSSRLANEKKKDYKDPPFIGPWKLGKLIGQGASGRVRHAINTASGTQAAIKIVPKQILASSRMSIRDVSAKQDKMTLGIEREIVIMKLIEHPNVLGLMDVYETSKELYLILEYVAGGELFDYLVSKGRLRAPEARAYFRQIIFGLHYCHSFNICHRDLKPENLLLDGSKRVVKVADFGMAALQPSEKMLETSCGSPHYASPEIVSGKSYKGTASDIWSCGIILFALLCGRLPFDDPNIQTLLGKVRLGKFDMPDYLEAQAKDLIWKMLTVDPEKRANMKDIMRHPWFTDNGSLSGTNPVSTDLDRLAEEEMDMDNLDLDILSNLKTLWPEFSQQDIVNQLTSKSPNWQKTFYALLVQHRENYSGDDDDDDDEEEQQGREISLTPNQPKPNSLGLSLGITPAPPATTVKAVNTPANTATVSPITSRPVSMGPASPSKISTPLQSTQDRSTIRSTIPSRGASSPVPPPLNDENRRPVSMLASPPGSPRRPLPSPKQSPVKVLQAPQSGFGSAQHAQDALRDSRPSPISPRTIAPPALQVVQPVRASPVRPTHGRAMTDSVANGSPSTPNRSQVRSSSVVDDTTPKQTLPPRPSSRAGMTRPQSAQGQRRNDAGLAGGLPAQVGNVSMQQFFREIADELSAITVNGERPISLQRKLEQLERMAAEVRTDGRGSSPRREDDPAAQFDDAEDDVEDCYSVRSGTASEASTTPYTPSTPMTELSSPPLRTKPLAIVDKETSGRMPANILNNQSGRATSVQSTQSASSAGSGGSSLGRRRSLLLGRIKSQKKSPQMSDPKSPSVAYERLQEAGRQAQAPTQSRLQARNPGLGLDIASPVLGINTPSLKSPAFSMYSQQSSAPPTPSTPSSAVMSPGPRSSSNASPKQSWFAGLFNWKPATFTLMSVENFSTTHTEMKRLLLSCGARVFVEDSENAGILKCSMAEMRGAQGEVVVGSTSGSKPLRFRVEFQNLPMSSVASPLIGTPRSGTSSVGAKANASGVTYATSVTLVQEKGSLSTFKQIYHALQGLWTLDMQPNRTPVLGSSPINSPAIAQVGLGVSMQGSPALPSPGLLSPR